MMNKIYHAKGMPFVALMCVLMEPGIVKPETTNLGFSGVEIRSFFKINHPEKLVYSKKTGGNVC